MAQAVESPKGADIRVLKLTLTKLIYAQFSQ